MLIVWEPFLYPNSFINLKFQQELILSLLVPIEYSLEADTMLNGTGSIKLSSENYQKLARPKYTRGLIQYCHRSAFGNLLRSEAKTTSRGDTRAGAGEPRCIRLTIYPTINASWMITI